MVEILEHEEGCLTMDDESFQLFHSILKFEGRAFTIPIKYRHQSPYERGIKIESFETRGNLDIMAGTLTLEVFTPEVEKLALVQNYFSFLILENGLQDLLIQNIKRDMGMYAQIRLPDLEVVMLSRTGEFINLQIQIVNKTYAVVCTDLDFRIATENINGYSENEILHVLSGAMRFGQSWCLERLKG